MRTLRIETPQGFYLLLKEEIIEELHLRMVKKIVIKLILIVSPFILSFHNAYIFNRKFLKRKLIAGTILGFVWYIFKLYGPILVGQH